MGSVFFVGTASAVRRKNGRCSQKGQINADLLFATKTEKRKTAQSSR